MSRHGSAQRTTQPTVAIESTVFAHGLPHPANAEAARDALRAATEEGATGRVIAVVAGEVRVGLSEEELIALCQEGPQWLKVSLSDLGPAVAGRRHGATTVAATAFLAARHGISVTATGGLGGIHRGFTNHLDISADLTALATCPVIVVCSGVKVVLDVAATVEALETLGICVVGYHTDTLPGFYCSATGIQLSWHANSEAEIAKMWKAQQSLGRTSALVVVQAPPSDYALPADLVEQWIERACREAERAGVRGKAITPFLLRRLAELSDGKTVELNRRLLVENVRLAARIARCLAEG